MKNLDLNSFGVEEMNANKMKVVDGGCSTGQRGYTGFLDGIRDSFTVKKIVNSEIFSKFTTYTHFFGQILILKISL